MADPRATRAWRALRDRVVLEEPTCRLQLRGCTGISTTADHIETVTDRPDLAMDRSNLRGACKPCNDKRGQMPDDEIVLGGAAPEQSRALSIFKPLESL
jgi:5-methylcytosine-specific restriction endonuclease McrA